MSKILILPQSIFNVLLLLTAIFGLIACYENNPIIPPLGPQELGDKKVLVEEFTGIRCVNCPQGSEEIESLRALFGENLIAVSIHAGSFSSPYSDSRYDFRTADGNALQDLLGQPLGYPSAVINRKSPTGGQRLQSGQSNWSGFIEQELQQAANMSMTIEADFDTNTRALSVDVQILPTTTIAEALYLTVLLAEDNVVDKQLTPEGENPDYMHRHVFRRLLTNGVNGLALENPLVIGTQYTNRFSITLPDDWVSANCSVVAFIHQTGESKAVWQAEEVKVSN